MTDLLDKIIHAPNSCLSLVGTNWRLLNNLDSTLLDHDTPAGLNLICLLCEPNVVDSKEPLLTLDFCREDGSYTDNLVPKRLFE